MKVFLRTRRAACHTVYVHAALAVWIAGAGSTEPIQCKPQAARYE